MASLIVLVAGALLAVGLGLVKPMPPLGLSQPELVMPAWDVATLIGLGVPLYLVTMASQNLPGFAVLRASGYQPPTQPVLARHRRGLAGHGLPRRAHLQSGGDLGRALHRAGSASRSGRALEGRRLLRPVVGPGRAVRRLAGRPVRRACRRRCWPRSPALRCWARWRAPWARPRRREGSLRRRRHAGRHRVGRHADGRRLGLLGPRLRPRRAGRRAVRQALAGAGKRVA